MRVEHDKPVRADDTHDCRGSEEIEAEDAISRGFPGDGMGSDRHEFAMNGPPIFAVAYHLAFHRACVDTRQIFFHAACEQRPVRDFTEVFRDEPDVFFCGHPVKAIEPGQVDRRE